MSGLEEIGELPGFIPGYGAQVAQRDLDQYTDLGIDSPSVSASWFGTANGGTAASAVAITLLNQNADWPRNIYYNLSGVSGGTFGGTFVANLIDQFGVPVTESVYVNGTTTAGVYGTAIAMKFLSGSFTSQGSSGGSAGTAQIGFGTASNGSAQSNWFGLLTKIAGTADIKTITWVSTNTATTLNKGTNLGTLVNTSTHSFQGTSGVAVTDHYKVIMKSTYDNNGKGQMSNL